MNTESDAVPAGSPTSVRRVVLGFLAFVAASAYLTRYCISAANTTMQEDLGFSATQMGQLMSAFGIGYLLFQVPCGALGSKIGSRLAFVALSVLWSLANVWTAVVSLFSMMWAARFALGVFQAGLVPVSAKIVKDWMPVSSRGMASAVIAASMSVGGTFTIWLTGWMLSEGYDWRVIFTAYAAVGIVWAAVFAFFFRNEPEEHPGVNDSELRLIRQDDVPQDTTSDDAPAPPPQGIGLDMLMSVGMWGLCVQAFFRAAGYAFFVTWFFAFLEYVYKIPKSEAGFLNSLPLMAIVVGSLLGGQIIDLIYRWTGSKWKSRTGTAIAALIVSGTFTMASAWTSSATQLASVIAVGALFSGLCGPAMWAAAIDIGGRHTAVVMATMNMVGGLANVVLPLLLGSWFDRIRDSGGDWDQVIYLHAGFYFAAAISWLFVNSNREVSRSAPQTSL